MKYSQIGDGCTYPWTHTKPLNFILGIWNWGLKARCYATELSPQLAHALSFFPDNSLLSFEAGFRLLILLSEPPETLGVLACATVSGLSQLFKGEGFFLPPIPEPSEDFLFLGAWYCRQGKELGSSLCSPSISHFRKSQVAGIFSGYSTFIRCAQ